MRMSEIIDISQAVDEKKTPAYYGDTPFTLQWIYDDEVKTSEIKSHAARWNTHVDSPMHFLAHKTVSVRLLYRPLSATVS